MTFKTTQQIVSLSWHMIRDHYSYFLKVGWAWILAAVLLQLFTDQLKDQTDPGFPAKFANLITQMASSVLHYFLIAYLSVRWTRKVLGHYLENDSESSSLVKSSFRYGLWSAFLVQGIVTILFLIFAYFTIKFIEIGLPWRLPAQVLVAIFLFLLLAYLLRYALKLTAIALELNWIGLQESWRLSAFMATSIALLSLGLAPLGLVVVEIKSTIQSTLLQNAFSPIWFVGVATRWLLDSIETLTLLALTCSLFEIAMDKLISSKHTNLKGHW